MAKAPRTQLAFTESQTLDNAVRLMTAFRSWEEMFGDITRTGYRPTLRDDDAVAPAPEHKEAMRLIREACDRAGFCWYDGTELHNAPRARPAVA